jgi:hypothetical protein
MALRQLQKRIADLRPARTARRLGLPYLRIRSLSGTRLDWIHMTEFRGRAPFSSMRGDYIG